MKILLIGDIFGKSGREIIEKNLEVLKKKYNPDWVIANGENTTAGNGISPGHARKMKQAGIDILTSGNHLFARRDWRELMEKCDWVLRPHNIGGDEFPGAGFRIFTNEKNQKLGVMNLAGRVFMEDCVCPFRMADKLLEKFPKDIPVILDFHAEASSEKIALFWYLSGRISAVVGTHTHVQTADERILPGGTAVISDIGMTGALNGVIGVDRNIVIDRFLHGYSDKFQCAFGEKKLEGVIIELNNETNKAESIKRIRWIY